VYSCIYMVLVVFYVMYTKTVCSLMSIIIVEATTTIVSTVHYKLTVTVTLH